MNTTAKQKPGTCGTWWKGIRHYIRALGEER